MICRYKCINLSVVKNVKSNNSEEIYKLCFLWMKLCLCRNVHIQIMFLCFRTPKCYNTGLGGRAGVARSSVPCRLHLALQWHLQRQAYLRSGFWSWPHICGGSHAGSKGYCHRWEYKLIHFCDVLFLRTTLMHEMENFPYLHCLAEYSIT